MNKNLRSFTMEVFLSTIVIALILLEGCAATSTQYQRQNAANGEIVWRYDRGLKATKDNTVVSEADGWDGLADAVACVPEAKILAVSASRHYRLGAALWWGGLLAGGALLAAPFYISNDAPAEEALGIIMFEMVASVTCLLLGNYMENIATPEAIDAVNIYNNKFRENPECSNDSTISSHNSNKNVK
jgi:hypothetical protein